MLPCFVMVDLETSGGNAANDRITEIAAVRIENGREVARWCTLVNPGVPIPPFIQNLTGITDAMVENADPFAAIAAQLMALLEGAVFVAHNVHFDYGFVTHELARLGLHLQVNTLCTVRLSRKLYPQHRAHGLDAIMQRHGLHTATRHRALGDVEMVLAWLRLAQLDHGADIVVREANALLQTRASLPPLLESTMHDIPPVPGAYMFFGDSSLPLYVGKSVNLRARVLAHFQTNSKVVRDQKLVETVRRIEWHEAAGEIGASLMASRLVKELQPVHNRRRHERPCWAWTLLPESEHPVVRLVNVDMIDITQLGDLYGLYASKRKAQDSLRRAAELHGLCHHALGLESGTGSCRAHPTGPCRGLCVGRETAPNHRVRLQMALAETRIRAWPYAGRMGLREVHPTTGRTDIHVFDQWCHLTTAHDEAELHDVVTTRQAVAFDLDTYCLLLKQLSNPTRQHLSVFRLPSRSVPITSET